ncbi:MAG TPA: AmmeMemoRadiSam system protein B [Polyangia bacterium]|nr:AmmeMemoRadiSam system protein B [Polyangia bacterium]
MAAPLPRLRADLDLIPSPLPEQPGLVVRDPLRYSPATLIIPPLLARCLGCFDGSHDEGELHATLARLVGRAAVAGAARRLIDALSEAGFLQDQRFEDLRGARERGFAACDARLPVHAGNAYPAEPAPLTETLRSHFDATPAGATAPASAPICAIVAPHVSPEGGRASYASAYRALPADHADRVFVVLGTSHYGEPDRYGLTRKPFATPFGLAPTEVRLVDDLARAAPDAVAVEDYCHAVEHSIEFQVVFLQHLFGPEVRILPVLCGPFAAGPRAGRPPEASDRVARFIGALGELAAREGRRLSFVLGVDFAHIGRRYGDGFEARVRQGPLAMVEARDRARLERIAAGDADGFWELVAWRTRPVDDPGPREDELKWCGTSPLYTFLRALPDARGRLLCYEQWNIDHASVVSFGALAFPENERA